MDTLLVGPNEQRILVHEDYLTRNLAFFRAALRK